MKAAKDYRAWNLTREEICALAKVRVAEHLSRRRLGPVPDVLATLSHSDSSLAHRMTKVHRRLSQAGLIQWDNGSILSAHGAAMLDEIIDRKANAYTVGGVCEVQVPASSERVRSRARGGPFAAPDSKDVWLSAIVAEVNDDGAPTCVITLAGDFYSPADVGPDHTSAHWHTLRRLKETF